MTVRITADRDSSFGQALISSTLERELFLTLKDDLGDVKWSGVVNAYHTNGLSLSLDLDLVTTWIDGKIRDITDLAYQTARRIGVL